MRGMTTTRQVVYLTPLYFDDQSCVGGGERYPLNLARGVVAAGSGRYAVELVSFGKQTRRRVLAPGLTLQILATARKPANSLDVLSWDLPAALASADLVHIHQAFTRTAEVGILLARQLGKKVCLTDHGGMTSTLGLQLGTLDLVDCIVAYSDFGASLYHTNRPIAVVKGGVDADRFAPPENRPHRDHVLFVGRILPHKGIDQLIEALPPELELIVCGRPYDPHYLDRLKTLAQSKHVEFLLDCDDTALPSLYARAWATVLPSVYQDCLGNAHVAPELMGFTLLESMACGTPAICSRVGGMPEFVLDGQTGFIYDDLEELGSGLRLLARQPALADQMGRHGRSLVEQQFDLRVAGARLMAIYDRLIEGRGEVAA
jgi:glycosyltransferase involved in cell wall biosynthesis